MRILILTLLVVLAGSAFSQKREYLDEHKNKLSSPEDAKYYRLAEQRGTLFHVVDYYVSNDQTSMVATATEVSPKIKFEGKFKSFFENGQVEYEGAYKDNKCVGNWKHYHENGQQADETFYKGDTIIYRQAWDESGTALLHHGTGTFIRNAPATDGLFYYNIQDSLLTTVYTTDKMGSDTVYIKAEKQAEYNGGLDALSRKLSTTVVYPKQARRLGVEGIVYVSFVVDRNGQARDVKCIKGIGAGCDEAAKDAVSTLNEWSPALVKDKAVISRMVQPVSFRLTKDKKKLAQMSKK